MNEGKMITNSELCRLCLKNPGLDDLFEKTDLVRDVYLCTGVKLLKSDNLPRKICFKCLETVTNAKHLRIMVKENETHMKIFFGIDLNKNQDQKLDKATKAKIVNSKENTEVGSSDENSTDTDEQEKIRKALKRQRSSSPENVQEQKLFIRKDLFGSSKNMTIPGKEGTYTEGTKYGISKTRTTNSLGNTDITYTCAMCPKTFPTWKKVYCHQRMHNKNIICPRDKCGKKFATKGDLEKHMRTHTGERPYNCDMCDRSFSQRVTLKAHKESVHPPEPLSEDSDRLVMDLNR